MNAEQRIKTLMDACGRERIPLLPQFNPVVAARGRRSLRITDVGLKGSLVEISGELSSSFDPRIVYRSHRLFSSWDEGRRQVVADALEGALLACSRHQMEDATAGMAPDGAAALEALAAVDSIRALRALSPDVKGVIMATLDDTREEHFEGRWKVVLRLAPLSFVPL